MGGKTDVNRVTWVQRTDHLSIDGSKQSWVTPSKAASHYSFAKGCPAGLDTIHPNSLEAMLLAVGKCRFAKCSFTFKHPPGQRTFQAAVEFLDAPL